MWKRVSRASLTLSLMAIDQEKSVTLGVPAPYLRVSSSDVTRVVKRRAAVWPAPKIHQRIEWTQWLVGFAFGVVMACSGCSDFAPKSQRNWQLVWHDGRWRHYYVDTSTIRVVGNTAAATSWDVSILATRSLRHFVGLPRVTTTREGIKVQCSTYTVSGTGVTSTSTGLARQTGEMGVSVFADTANAAGPHTAAARFLCIRARGRSGKR